MKAVRLSVLWAACLLACPLGATARAFQLEDVQKIVTLGDPQISPDGKEIAVMVSTPDWKTDKARKEIDLVNAANGTRRALVANRENLSSPHWSPDGKRLAFLAKDPHSGKTQIFVMSASGGAAARATAHSQGVDDYAWSPDGRSFAFIAQDPSPNAAAIKAHNKVFRVTRGHFLLDEEVAPWQLWVAPVAGGKATQLTRGTASLGTDHGGATTPVWSRDGTRIAFTEFPDMHWASSFHSVVAAVDLASGDRQVLVSAEGAGDVAFAPTGDAYAFSRPRGGDQNNGDAVYASVDGTTYDATAALARHIHDYRWMPDGRTLMIAGALGTHTVLWKQPLSGKATLLDLGEVEANNGLSVTASSNTTSMSVSRTGAVAFIGATANHPCELYVLDAIDAKPRRL
ncbi:MAG TPA: hypothetical protein VFG49_02080, partial [Dyella sp.]|uniref:TolB family protein n=1 Tax=Dyella sp. TaxID=1869338 RepID=UPI002D7A1499